MNQFYPMVKEIIIKIDEFCDLRSLGKFKCAISLFPDVLKEIGELNLLQMDPVLEDFKLIMGEPEAYVGEIQDQGYVIIIKNESLLLEARDREGFFYGLDTLKQVLAKRKEDRINTLEIYDYPVLKKRGVMLDVSRGKVYTLEYLLNLMDVLKALRFNVFQLYIEHTFEFKSHESISLGSSPLTSSEILTLQKKCEENGIELQANLQSLGHMNRILTRPEYQDLAESPMFWSLDTTSEESYQLLDDLYGEFLPLFKSPWLNVCSDEPYDLGRGRSASQGKEVGELYLDHLLRLHKLAKKYHKKIMIFGDVVKVHPEYVDKMPEDIIYLDWIYDPKEEYSTPKLFQKAGIPFWVSPGTGNWNTLFPRLRGSLVNILHLTLEGIEAGAEGMLLTDWNDHGGYTQPGPAYYSYSYAAAVAWTGNDPGQDQVNTWMDRVLGLPGYSEIILKLGSIYEIPPLWSKNRSQDVMALFDEPIFGKAIRGEIPPKELVAYDLELPEGVEPVYERHSQHPLRPYFSMTTAVQEEIGTILEEVKPLLHELQAGIIKNQLCYIVDAYDLMGDKLKLSRKTIAMMESRDMTISDFIQLEDELRVMIKRYVHLQLSYISRWFEVAKESEIEISLTYFAQIISRLEYLKNWLSIQREEFDKKRVDWAFDTYETAGYETLPTY